MLDQQNDHTDDFENDYYDILINYADLDDESVNEWCKEYRIVGHNHG